MIARETKQELLAKGEVVAAPADPDRACTDQTFELPTGLYTTMALMFAGFVAVLSLVLRGGHMAVGYAAIFAFIAVYFAIPFIFPRLAGRDGAKPLSWDEFGERGIVTATGHMSAGEATVLVLLLPFLILCFGVAIAILAVTL